MAFYIHEKLEKGRVLRGYYASKKGDLEGAFFIRNSKLQLLTIIASHGNEEVPWEHVSISLPSRCPNWEEMCFVKSLFWEDEDIVMQLHPPKSSWINNHPFCLHLWRPINENIPLPPSIAVGYKSLNL